MTATSAILAPGHVAVLTGAGSGFGRELALLCAARGMRLVLADIQSEALDATLALLPAGSEALALRCDVAKAADVMAMAEQTYDRFGAAHLLFNNAGVSAGGLSWQSTEDDWNWVLGVNLMGVVHGIRAFVPRMIAGGEEGHVINTSSGDGGVSPLPYQSVYASSKAAVSCITECLAAQLQTENTKLGASIFYPSGGLLDTGIWTTDRNRPAELAREKPYAPVPTVQDFKVAAEAAGMELHVQDLDELARYCLQGIRERRFVIMIGLEQAEQTLLDRAARIGRAELPINLAEVPQL